MTLEENIREMYYRGKSCIQIQKYLRENNMIVSYIEVKKLFLREVRNYYGSYNDG